MPASKTISLLHWNTIIDRIYEKRCVPFLGAGVNAADDGSGLPLSGQVARKLLNQFLEPADLAEIDKYQGPNLSSSRSDLARAAHLNLARVALHVECELKKDYEGFINTLRKIIPDDKKQPSLLLDTLAQLPLQLIITTNYDRLMERALDQRGKKILPIYQPVEGFDGPTLALYQDQLSKTNDVVVYKIHGTFRDDPDEPDRIIVTEEDYIQFLLTIGGGKDLKDLAIPGQVLSKVKTSTLLFLGYSLEDWDFRAIFEALRNRDPQKNRPISYAVQLNPSEFWVDYWADRDVVIFDMDLDDFAAQLESRYVAEHGSLGVCARKGW